MIFKKSEGDTAVDLLEVEVALRMALQEVSWAISDATRLVAVVSAKCLPNHL